MKLILPFFLLLSCLAGQKHNKKQAGIFSNNDSLFLRNLKDSIIGSSRQESVFIIKQTGSTHRTIFVKQSDIYIDIVFAFTLENKIAERLPRGKSIEKLSPHYKVKRIEGLKIAFNSLFENKGCLISDYNTDDLPHWYLTFRGPKGEQSINIYGPVVSDRPECSEQINALTFLNKIFNEFSQLLKTEAGD